MIREIPEIPSEIIKAIDDKTLAVFIGAGVSRLIGCKGWNDTAKLLVERCFKEGFISFREKQALFERANNDPKKAITICHQIFKKKNKENDYWEELEKALKPDNERKKKYDIYRELFNIGTVFITTNIDEHFDEKFEEPFIFFKETDLEKTNLEGKKKLFHIHGSIKERDAVFTVSDYIKRYNSESFRKFMEEVFQKYTVLFVGYGLSEFEILDFLIEKFHFKDKKHFILQPYFEDEEKICELDKHYFHSLGIKLIPYAIDEKGYDQLYYVIKDWCTQVKVRSAELYSINHEVEKLVKKDNLEEAEILRIFQTIKNDSTYRNLFFKKLSQASNSILWFRRLKEKGFFDLQKYFSFEPVVFEYLKTVADKNNENPSEEITNALVEIVDSIGKFLLNDEKEVRKHINQHLLHWYLLQIIFSLPVKKITEAHFQFLKEALKQNNLVSSEVSETILPKLINKKAVEHVLQLIEIIFDYKKEETISIWDEGRRIEYFPIMDEYWLQKALEKHAKDIAKLCGIEAAKVAIEKIKTIVSEDAKQFNVIWIPTIEDHPQTEIFSDRYECQLVHFVRNVFEMLSPGEIKSEVENLLKEEHSIFKRIAIHTINYHYHALSELFWQSGENLLKQDFLKHELYELFKNRVEEFNEKQINRIISWIEELSIDKENLNGKYTEEQIEQMIASQRKEWLTAFLLLDNPKVKSLYEKYNQLYPYEIKHPGFLFWMEKGKIRDSKERKRLYAKFLEKSNKEIAQFLIDYKGNLRAIDREDLADIFRDSVASNPKKFISELEMFLNIPSLYQHALLWGFLEAWESGYDIDWVEVFNFIENLLDSKDFWREKSRPIINYKSWIISRIAEIVENVSKRENFSLTKELSTKIEKILSILIENTESVLESEEDLITAVLNSPKGKVVSAAIDYSLRCMKESRTKWLQTIKEEISRRLNRKVEPSLEFSVVLGERLVDLYRIDKNWVIENINKIFPEDNEQHWKGAFTSYLFFARVIYKSIYTLLKESGHYERALTTVPFDSSFTEQLVQHICIAYLQGWESLEDKNSLIYRLIEKSNVEQLNAIVNYFSLLSRRRENIANIADKVKLLLRRLYDIAIKREQELEYQKLLAKLSNVVFLINRIDKEILEWLKISIKHFNDSSKAFPPLEILEYMLGKVKGNPKEIASIFLYLTKKGIYFTYKKEDVQKLVETLYEKGEKETANMICNLYGIMFSQYGNENFLFEIYKKYNNVHKTL